MVIIIIIIIIIKKLKMLERLAYCSGRSSNTKPSCNKTELNRNSETMKCAETKRKFLYHHQNCRKSSDQGRTDTGEHRCSWGRETPITVIFIPSVSIYHEG